MSRKEDILLKLHGPWRFKLVSHKNGHIADGVRFSDDACVVRLRVCAEHDIEYTDTHSSFESVLRTYSRGFYSLEWVDPCPIGTVWLRAYHECQLDFYENCHFASIGGVEARSNPKAPSYIEGLDRIEYVQGYLDTALILYGEGWETCPFG